MLKLGASEASLTFSAVLWKGNRPIWVWVLGALLHTDKAGSSPWPQFCALENGWHRMTYKVIMLTASQLGNRVKWTSNSYDEPGHRRESMRLGKVLTSHCPLDRASCRIVCRAAAAESLQPRPTLCDPRDGSPPGSPVPGVLQARALVWVAISFSRAWKWKGKVKSLSRVRLFETPWTAAYQAPPSMGSSRQEYWSGVPLPSL